MIVHDPVNSPLHYKRDDIECIDAMKQTTSEEGFAEYCRLNAFKYIWRANNKQNKEQDIQKAVWYLRMSIGDDPREQGQQIKSREHKNILRELGENFWYAE